jgi:hypothetical protein
MKLIDEYIKDVREKTLKICKTETGKAMVEEIINAIKRGYEIGYVDGKRDAWNETNRNLKEMIDEVKNEAEMR